MAAAASYSPAEAAYIVGRPVKAVQKAIDEGDVASRRVRQGRTVVRRLGEPELVYLRLLKDISGTLLPAARKRLYRGLKEQRDGASAVRLGPVTVEVSDARRDVTARVEELRRRGRWSCRTLTSGAGSRWCGGRACRCTCCWS